MSSSPNAPSGGAQLVNALKRQWLAALIVTFVVAGMAFAAVGVILSPSYTATTSILINPLVGNPLAPGTKTDQITSMPTEGRLVPSDAVAAKLGDELGKTFTGDLLRKKVTVNNPVNTAVLEISFTASTSAAAVKGANAVAAAYLLTRTDRSTALTQANRSSLQSQRSSVSRQLTEAANALSRTSAGSASYTVLVEKISGLSGQITSLDQQLADLATSLPAPGTVLVPATAPSAPDGPGTPIVLVVALLVGLSAGAGAAWLLELLTARVRSLRDLNGLGAPVIVVQVPDDLSEPGRALSLSDADALESLFPLQFNDPVVVVVARTDATNPALPATIALGTSARTRSHTVAVVDAGDGTKDTWDEDDAPAGFVGVWGMDGPIETPRLAMNLGDVMSVMPPVDVALVASPPPGTRTFQRAGELATGAMLVVQLGGTRMRHVRRSLSKLEDTDTQLLAIVAVRPQRQQRRAQASAPAPHESSVS